MHHVRLGTGLGDLARRLYGVVVVHYTTDKLLIAPQGL
jgi:pantoate kinase